MALHFIARLKSRIENENVLLAAGFSSLIVRGLGSVVTFLLGVVLARHLGPQQFGVYGLILASALLLSVIAQAGLPTLSTREIAVGLSRGEWSRLKGVFVGFGRFVLTASVVIGTLLAVTAISWRGLFATQSIGFAAGALLIPLLALTALVAGQLRGLHKVVVSQGIETLVRPALTLLCMGIALTSIGLTASTAIFMTIIAAMLSLAFGLARLRREVPTEVREAEPVYSSREWTRSAWPLASVDILRQVEANYGILLLGILASDQVTGIFRLALAVTVASATPLGIFHMVLSPTLARLSAHGQHSSLQRVLGRSAALMFGMLAAVAMLLLFAGQWVIVVVFGVEYLDAWPPMMFLVFAQVVNGAFGMGSILLAMGGGERQLTTSYVMSVIVGIGVAISLVDTHGAAGVAAAAIVAAVIQNALVWRAVHSQFGLDCTPFALLTVPRR